MAIKTTARLKNGANVLSAAADGASPLATGTPRWRHSLLFVCGLICVGIGIVGIGLPGLPGTVFLLMAAACFTRSSPRFEAWLLNHPRFGPPIRHWRETRAIPRRVKQVACLSLAVSWIVALAITPIYAALSLAAVLAGVAIFILTRPDGPGSV